MLRIWTTNESGWIVITVDGDLVSDYIEEVESCCNKAITQNKSVRLCLREVPHIDDRGRLLLSRLAAQGVELSGSGLYISYIVEEVRREAGTVNGRGD